MMESLPYDFEVCENMNVNAKIKLRDKNPPCIISFQYKSLKDLKVYISKNNKDPDESSN
jgi:hypothetical protein